MTETMTATKPTPPASPLAGPDAWNLVSLDYTRDFAPHCEEYAADALARVPLAAGARVVDVAAGPGTLALQAAARGLRVTAVDFSADMIALLGGRAATQGVRVDACVGDGEKLPFADGVFDAGFSIFGLMFFADRARGLRELRRVLAPGGRAVVSSWAPLESTPAIGALFAALRWAASELTIPPAPSPLGDPEELRRAMVDAGFGDVRVDTVSHALLFNSPRSFWFCFARSAAPIALLRERLGEVRWAEVSLAVVEELSARLPPGPLSVPMPAHLGIGTR